MGNSIPNKIIASAFYPATPKEPGVTVVGPILRDEIKLIKSLKGKHILVYVKGKKHFTRALKRTLLKYKKKTIVIPLTKGLKKQWHLP